MPAHSVDVLIDRPKREPEYARLPMLTQVEATSGASRSGPAPMPVTGVSPIRESNQGTARFPALQFARTEERQGGMETRMPDGQLIKVVLIRVDPATRRRSEKEAFSALCRPLRGNPIDSG
jgi:hypothetical protein